MLAAGQRAALDAVLRTVQPATLKLPRTVLDILPPRPYGVSGSQELFDRYTGLVFDAVAPAASAADMSLSLLLDPERAARLVQQSPLPLRDLSDPARILQAALIVQYSSAIRTQIGR